MQASKRDVSFTWIGVCVALLCSGAALRADSMHVFGIHFFDWGAAVDVMSHRTGWVVEANITSDGSGPHIGGRYEPAVAQGFTILQRLDWSWELAVPHSEAEQEVFADQIRHNWVRHIKPYCRHYSIGNEVEFGDVTPEIYASAFRKVRDAIRAEQPEAIVIIGHMISGNNQRQAIRLLGRDGYDGLTAHTGSTVPDDLLDMLDEENARPEVGLYITEWGWVAGTNPSAAAVMRRFYDEIGQSNATRNRQVYCACWYLYPSFLGSTFSLELSPIDNAAFEACTALGTSLNSYADNPTAMTELYADIPDHGQTIELSWTTDTPSRTQLYWTPLGQSGAGYDAFTLLDGSLRNSHDPQMVSLSPQKAYEVMPNSTADDYGDAGGRRFRVKSGPWTTTVVQTGAGRVQVEWMTDWEADSRVEYGSSLQLGQKVESSVLVSTHQVMLMNLSPGNYWYRVASAEPHPDGDDPLIMRSPIRSFTVEVVHSGDLDEDGDVDQVDFGMFQACYSGPGIVQNESGCAAARLDEDEDVDQDDFGVFQTCFSGPGIPSDPDCAM
jgi:hypothetical protein